MSPVHQSLPKLLVCWLLLSTAGCATLNLANLDLRSRKATARNPVVRVVCLWEPAEGRDPQGIPCQGFAGQILFLTSKSLPVSVDGDVRIYLFDDQGTAEAQAKPVHQFDFDSGAWAQHYSYGTLGPAYNVFVPYTRRGVAEATCDLRVRLTPDDGPIVFSEMTSIQVMGFNKGTKTSRKESATDPRVESTVPDDLTGVNKRRRTTTIALNSNNGVANDSAAPLPEDSADSPIQLASHQTEDDARPLTNDDARIAQLEQLVEALRQQSTQANAPRSAAAAQPIPAAGERASAPPRRLDEEPPEPSRFRIRAAASPMENPAAAAKQPDRASAPRSPAPHPLEIGSEPDQAPRSARGHTSPHRHPLLDADDEHPLAEPAPRRSIPAADAPARQTPEWFDAFDPIDTEAAPRSRD